MPIRQLYRVHGIAESAFNRWRRRYWGLEDLVIAGESQVRGTTTGS